MVGIGSSARLPDLSRIKGSASAMLSIIGSNGVLNGLRCSHSQMPKLLRCQTLDAGFAAHK
jgi:hypothetical protein